MSDYSWKELMAVVFSREIKDTDKITSGAHTEIFFAATMLAQKTHAPNHEAAARRRRHAVQRGRHRHRGAAEDIDRLRADPLRESVHDHPDTFLFYGAPGGARYYKEGSDLRDVNHFWFADKFFVGGIQADKWGNTNMIGLGKPGKFTFRGPGTIGINDIADRRARHLCVHHRARQAPPGGEGRFHLASRQEGLPRERVLRRRAEDGS